MKRYIIYEDSRGELHRIPLHPATPSENFEQIMKINARITGVTPVRAWLETATEEEFWNDEK